MQLIRNPGIPILAAALFVAQCQAAPAHEAAAPETVRVAFIDPLSGPFANAGESSLRHLRAAFDDINARTGGPAYRFELVALDGKGQVQESLAQLRFAADRGIRYVVQGQSSAVALALSEAIGKHNGREPESPMLLLNYAAIDPDLTNARCSFWHFRFDASSDMRIEALGRMIERDRSVSRVFIIGQNYSFGQQVSRAAKEMLARRRPDVRIVGDELHPLGQVKDFSPYVAKIKAAGADTVITGNWGNDMTLLIKAAKDAGLNANFYTYYAGGLGTPTAMGEAAVGKVKQITEWHSNVQPNKTDKFAAEFKKKYGIDFYYLRVNTEMYMLAEAIKDAKSIDPLKVALKLEGMKWMSDTGEVEMRAKDHQLLNPLYISTIVRAGVKAGKPQPGGDKTVRYDAEDSGYGFKTDARIESYVAAQPTSCQMKRP